MLLRISPSMLDQWRVCRDGQFSKSGEDFIKYISEPRIATVNMAIGSAFHRLLERGESEFETTMFDESGRPYTVAVVEQDGWQFEFAEPAIELVRQVRNEYPGVSEVRTSKTYSFPLLGVDVYSEMVIDSMIGYSLIEFKTKMVDKEPSDWTTDNSRDHYRDSAQWRMYLDAVPGATKVIYTVLYLQAVEEEGSKRVQVSGYYEPLQFECHRYQSMHADIREELEGLIRFVQARGLLHLIEYKKKGVDYGF